MIFLYELNLTKSLKISFLNIYGIGKNQSIFLLKYSGFSNNFSVKDLTESKLAKVNKILKLKKILIKNNLKKKKFFNLKKLVELKTYKGLRRIQGLPIRGQRSRSNAKTSKKLNK